MAGPERLRGGRIARRDGQKKSRIGSRIGRCHGTTPYLYALRVGREPSRRNEDMRPRRAAVAAGGATARDRVALRRSGAASRAARCLAPGRAANRDGGRDRAKTFKARGPRDFSCVTWFSLGTRRMGTALSWPVSSLQARKRAVSAGWNRPRRFHPICSSSVRSALRTVSRSDCLLRRTSAASPEPKAH